MISIKINDRYFLLYPTLFNLNNNIAMDEFDLFSMEIDADLIGQDFDDIDPFGEDKFEYEEYDDGGILYE